MAISFKDLVSLSNYLICIVVVSDDIIIFETHPSVLYEIMKFL